MPSAKNTEIDIFFFNRPEKAAVIRTIPIVPHHKISAFLYLEGHAKDAFLSFFYLFVHIRTECGKFRLPEKIFLKSFAL